MLKGLNIWFPLAFEANQYRFQILENGTLERLCSIEMEPQGTRNPDTLQLPIYFVNIRKNVKINILL